MRRTWLIFSQAVTVAVAILFVVATLKPEWLPRRSGSPAAAVLLPPVAEPAAQPVALSPSSAAVNSYAAAARRATPAVVSITARKAPARDARANDPWF